MTTTRKKKATKKPSTKKHAPKKPAAKKGGGDKKPPPPQAPAAPAGNKAPQLDISTLQFISDADAALLKIACGVPPAPQLTAAEAAIVAAFKPIKPGVERWPVKTGTDADADMVGTINIQGRPPETGIVKTTVEEMNEMQRPRDMQDITALAPAYQDHRSTPVETTIWQIEADLLLLKQEADGDFHLGLQGDGGNSTMVAEIPNPNPPFVNAAVSRWVDDILAARDEVNTKLDLANKVDVTQPFSIKIRERVRLTGVGFFDKVHGQSFVAPSNGIELHPVLRIEFL